MTLEDEQLRPGDLCDRYEIVRLIAVGDIGTVYEAAHSFTRQRIALKCVRLRQPTAPDNLERMRREAISLSRIDHANLVTVHDADVTPDGLVWIAMELLEGQTLRELLLRSGPLPVRTALHFAMEIASGLHAAHELGVVHRDVKPENVFVTTGHQVKVLDLGTATFRGWGLNATDPIRLHETPAYMSPEHAQGQKLDRRADIYALGLVLYEMIAGQHAFADVLATPSSALGALGTVQLRGAPRPLTEIAPACPPYIGAVVAKALSLDRDARYASMAELADALHAAAPRPSDEQDAASTVIERAGDAAFATTEPAARTASDASTATPSARAKLTATSADDTAGGGRLRLRTALALGVALGLAAVVVNLRVRQPSPPREDGIVTAAAERGTTAAGPPLPTTSASASAAPPPDPSAIAAAAVSASARNAVPAAAPKALPGVRLPASGL